MMINQWQSNPMYRLSQINFLSKNFSPKNLQKHSKSPIQHGAKSSKQLFGTQRAFKAKICSTSPSLNGKPAELIHLRISSSPSHQFTIQLVTIIFTQTGSNTWLTHPFSLWKAGILSHVPVHMKLTSRKCLTLHYIGIRGWLGNYSQLYWRDKESCCSTSSPRKGTTSPSYASHRYGSSFMLFIAIGLSGKSAELIHLRILFSPSQQITIQLATIIFTQSVSMTWSTHFFSLWSVANLSHSQLRMGLTNFKCLTTHYIGNRDSQGQYLHWSYDESRCSTSPPRKGTTSPSYPSHRYELTLKFFSVIGLSGINYFEINE